MLLAAVAAHTTRLPIVVVVIAAAAIVIALLASRRGRGGKRDNPALTFGQRLDERVQQERERGAAVEAFEQFLASNPAAGEALERFEGLDSALRLRLSAEGAAKIAFMLAAGERYEQSLTWLDEATRRDATYFETLNGNIAVDVFGLGPRSQALPKYPLQLVSAPDPDVTARIRARVLHGLGRHAEAEALLKETADDPRTRYVRAELRRQRGEMAGAIEDYRAVVAWNAEYQDVRRKLAEVEAIAAHASPNPGAPERAPAPTNVRLSIAAAPPPPPRPPHPLPIDDPKADARHVLGVEDDATAEEILAAYLALCRKFHPDLVAGLDDERRAEADHKMREINAAWKQLTRESSAA